jgi:hypothetical protein
MAIRRSILPSALVLLTAVLIDTGLYAQGSPGPVVYRFSVVGVVNAPQAKDVQYHLLAAGGTIDVVFIDECDCFKWTTGEQLDHAAVTAVLLAAGYLLQGEVVTSDGRTLVPALPMIDTR